MKKKYSNPTIRVVKLQQQSCILQDSVTGVQSNVVNYGGRGKCDDIVRSRSFDWDDD
jgi:hypothetical protein